MRFGIGIYTAEPLPKVVEQARLAERLGYDTLWLLDSQLVGRELYATMAACALATERILVGSGVTQPYTRHATVTACGFATLDELAPGRFLLGIARGDSAVLGLGAPVPTFKEFATYVDQVMRLLRGETIDINGKPIRLQFLDASSLPRVPLYIAAGGPKALAQACKLADHVIVHSGAGDFRLGKAMDLVRNGIQAAGKDPASVEIIWWTHASIDENWENVKNHYRPRVAGKFRHMSLAEFEELGIHLDPETVQRAKQSYNFVDHATAGAAHSVTAELIPESVWQELALLGSPEACYQTVRRGLERHPDISHVVINPPPPGFGLTYESIMEKFAAGVMAPLKEEAAAAT
jgi:5,10-methylenetetrahydromethanopterin reductase